MREGMFGGSRSLELELKRVGNVRLLKGKHEGKSPYFPETADKAYRLCGIQKSCKKAGRKICESLRRTLL
jgi:hypothetical protein